ncbi:MAG: sugar phosphate nucleotidyltransferase [Dehalococcoidales bacterium]|nr:sugar phosphate nucleotidyltransferase [Dehalococcoidales bacterium]
MKAIILTAGEGSRMRPLTYTRPKTMLPLANKPILEHLLIEAKNAGIRDFIFVVGYRDEQVRDYFGDGEQWGVNIAYSTQRKQLGTADAIMMVESLVNGNFLVINGDIIVNQKDINSLINKNDNTMSLFEVENARDLGVVEIKGDSIVCIHEKSEKPPSRMANAGLYLFTPDIFDGISQISKSQRGEYEITDALQMLIEGGHHVSYQEISYWLNLSYPWDLLTANESLLGRIKSQNRGTVEDNAVIKGAVYIGENTLVRSGSYIVGPVVIGQNCDIGPNCYIRPATAIGDNCHIGSAVEIKNSIVMKGSKIPHHNYLGDSVIGAGCNLGAGTKIANLRLDKKNINIAGINTARRKLGAIIGDNVQTGINACIDVGSMIGDNTHIGPGAIVGGSILSDSKIF